MIRTCRAASIISTLVLLWAGPTIAQTTPPTPQHIPLQKTIGQDRPEIVPSLIVMNARGATLQDGKLTLTGVAPNSIVFADRPVRAAGHSLTTDLLKEWSPEQTFTEDPPNATVSVLSTDGSKIRDAVVVLKTAKLEADRVTFDVDVLDGELAGGDGPAALFIDRFAFGGFHGGAGGFRGGVGGFHGDVGGFRGGYAHVGGAVGGVWHRPYVARGAWYRGAGYGAAAVGAAAVGGAALGAAAASAYPYGYGATCGYYPYPPCY
jgi:hypothetical protein